MKTFDRQRVFKSGRLSWGDSKISHLGLRRMIKSKSLRELLSHSNVSPKEHIEVVVPEPKRRVELFSVKEIKSFLKENPKQSWQVVNQLRSSPFLLAEVESVVDNKKGKQAIRKVSKDVLAEQKGYSLQALALKSPPRGFVEALKHIESPRREIRISAIQALIHVGNLPQFTKYANKIESVVVEQYLKEKSAYARNNIALCLGQSNNPDFSRLLSHIVLRDKSSHVVGTAVKALNKIIKICPADEKQRIVSVFERSLSHRQVDVRGAGLMGLAEHSPRKGLAMAVKFLSSKKTQIDKQNALHAMEVVLKNNPLLKDIIKKIVFRELKKREKLTKKERQREQYYESTLRYFLLDMGKTNSNNNINEQSKEIIPQSSFDDIPF